MSIKAGLGISTDKDSIKAVKEAVLQAKQNLGDNVPPNVAIVFSSMEFAHLTMVKTISSMLGPIDVLGCSTAAVICNAGIFRHAIGIMLLSITSDTYYATGNITDIKYKTAMKAGEEFGEKLLAGFKSARRDLGIVFSDGMIDKNSNLIYGIQERLGSSFPLVGALAMDNLRYSKTFVYYNQTVESDAACGLIMGGNVNFGLGIKHGWKPLGKPRFITRASGNIAYEIDDIPAATVYEDYLDCNLKELRLELRRIGTFYPIGIYLPGEEEYLLRNITDIGEDGSLILQGNIPENSQIRLMIGTKETCFTAAEQAVNEAKSDLTANSAFFPKINFALVFDSISRYMLLGRDAEKELDAVKKAVGPGVPVIGLYTYGEQGPLKSIDYHGKVYLHNQTISVLLVGE
ncbi:MAG: FIST N-terminal domain-containing protein [Candidatus Omnitrophota bacterium]|jgi:hypothetical protein